MHRLLILGLAVLCAACASDYTPSSQRPSSGLLGFRQAPAEAPAAPPLSRDDAEIALIGALKQAGWYSRPEYGFDEAYEDVATGNSSVSFLYRGSGGTERWSCPYAGTPAPSVKNFGFPEVRSGWRLVLGGCAGGSRGAERIEWTSSKDESARRFVDAWSVLAGGEADDPGQDVEFQKVVQQYRAARGDLPLTEALRAHRVAAEEAVKEQRFEDAAHEFAEALKLAPWWPQGHFNRGLILAELGAYSAAGREMKRYLLLEPAAQNARQVQDKIYAWQAKVK